ncbi:amidase family protein [Streptomyces sp. NPDC020800]|uniref:amidase family protein n=1 Tax=Streptomyces sp. NPDC020800 TaxID=3365092 RepID=UPI003790894B
MVIAWILKCERGSYSAHTLETRARNANPLTGAIEDHSTGGLAPEKARAASSMPAPRPRVLRRDVHHTRLWGVTRNPWNTEFTPGGSSGGAGAALAAGTTLLAPASGIGGLTRIPAAFTSTVDFEAPHGRNPGHGAIAADQYRGDGPTARTVDDVIALRNALCGPDPRYHTTIHPKLTLPTGVRRRGGDADRAVLTPRRVRRSPRGRGEPSSHHGGPRRRGRARRGDRTPLDESRSANGRRRPLLHHLRRPGHRGRTDSGRRPDAVRPELRRRDGPRPSPHS